MLGLEEVEAAFGHFHLKLIFFLHILAEEHYFVWASLLMPLEEGEAEESFSVHWEGEEYTPLLLEHYPFTVHAY